MKTSVAKFSFAGFLTCWIEAGTWKKALAAWHGTFKAVLTRVSGMPTSLCVAQENTRASVFTQNILCPNKGTSEIIYQR